MKKVVFLGTYSLHPRQQLLLESLKTSPDWEVTECRIDPWGAIADKTQASSLTKLGVLLKLLLAYPILALRYLCLPKHDVVVMMHAGLFDVLLLGGWVHLRRIPLVWDIYISVYDTLVHDRKMVKGDSMTGRLIHRLEARAARIADRLFLDTQAHAHAFEAEYQLPKQSVGVVYVGVDSEFTRLLKEVNPSPSEGSMKILFYGNYIPLHGIETIVEAFALLREKESDAELILVGDGQTEPLVEETISRLKVDGIQRINRLPYPVLISRIVSSNVCLGIFGTTDKAQRVIPNKVFQIAASGVPFVTADTPAVSELLALAESPLPCERVPAGDAAALADAILRRKGTFRGEGFVYGMEQVQEAFTSLLIEVVSTASST